ncbi:RSP_7527 family protein [Octadecabacter antarcticus]
MYKELSPSEVNKIVAQARAERAGAFGRMIKNLFRRSAA